MAWCAAFPVMIAALTEFYLEALISRTKPDWGGEAGTGERLAMLGVCTMRSAWTTKAR